MRRRRGGVSTAQLKMFGLEKIGQQSVQEARATVNEAIAKAEPLLRDVTNRVGGILHGLLDRLNGTTITLKVNIPPVPKAEAVE